MQRFACTGLTRSSAVRQEREISSGSIYQYMTTHESHVGTSTVGRSYLCEVRLRASTCNKLDKSPCMGASKEHTGKYTPVIIQVWTWTGEAYTCAIEHSTSNQQTSDHCIDITRDNKKLLLGSAQGLVMYDLDSIPTAEENRPESILSATNHTGDPTHVSTVPPDWIYAYAKGMRERGQILDQDNHKLLLLANEMMERLDPPGSSHVIRRDRLKIDAPILPTFRG